MALGFPCFKVTAITRIDANTMDVHGCRIFLDQSGNGLCDLVWNEGDFRIVDGTGFTTNAKIGAAIKARVLATIAAQPWVPPVPEVVISNAIGKTFATGSLNQVDDPDALPATSFDPGTAH